MSHRKVRALCEGAILVAAAQLLSYLRLWRMPWGGSIVLTMVPIVLYAVRWGFARGVFAGFVLDILQFTLDGGFAIGWQSIIGDYLLAYTAVGFAGLCRGKKRAAYSGTLLGSGMRFLVHFAVGATVWAEYMPEEFFGLTMTSPWFYSFLYNLAYMLPNMAITLLAFVILYRPMGKYLRAEDLI